MKKVFYNLFFALSLGILASCSTFGGGSQNSSTGTPSLGEESDVVIIRAPLGGAAYRAIPFTNNTGKEITITNVMFENNVCGDLSFYTITQYGNVIVNNPENISATISNGDNAFVNIRYTPLNCPKELAGYSTKMYVYYTDNNKTYRQSVTIQPTQDSGEEYIICTEDPRSFEYEDQNFTGRPPAGEYYLRIDKMVGYIYPGTSSLAAVVSTSDPNPKVEYIPTYLKLTVDDANGNFTFHRITKCEDFFVPGDPSILLYEPAYITTFTDFEGVFDEKGDTQINDFKAKLRANDLDGSLVATDAGSFQVDLEADLTSTVTEEDTLLGTILGSHSISVMNLKDGNRNNKYNLEGDSLKDGHMTFVTRGELINDENFLAKDGIVGILFANTPYIYIQLEVTFTKKLN
ncbi:hypothetical protein K1X76_02455 [bacterium]|nr:hypothetical protein [bacterium]